MVQYLLYFFKRCIQTKRFLGQAQLNSQHVSTNQIPFFSRGSLTSSNSVLKEGNSLTFLLSVSETLTYYQACEWAATVDNAVVNVVQCGVHDGKKIAVVRFSTFVVFIFTTCIIVDYF